MKIQSLLFLFSVVFSLPVYADQTENSEGKDTYQQYCSVCHASGLAGAPKFQNTDDWKPRLAQKGLEGLVKDSITGLNGTMPPKGSCTSCTDQQLKEAIEYMLPK